MRFGSGMELIMICSMKEIASFYIPQSIIFATESPTTLIAVFSRTTACSGLVPSCYNLGNPRPITVSFFSTRRVCRQTEIIAIPSKCNDVLVRDSVLSTKHVSIYQMKFYLTSFRLCFCREQFCREQDTVETPSCISM